MVRARAVVSGSPQWSTRDAVDTNPILPDYSGANVGAIVPGLLGGTAGRTSLPAWFPQCVTGANQVVLFVVDGLGWDQLQRWAEIAPTIAAMEGGPITTVAPSTTATALTSIATGLTPAEHGILGYRVDLGGEVVNMLRWSSSKGDARHRVPPRDLQPQRAFLGTSVPVVSKADLQNSAFTEAHLYGVRHHGWRVPSNLAVEVQGLLERGERFVYAYYDGLDKVAHEFGFGPFYDAELRTIDRMVGDLLDLLPSGAVLCVTADHGQVHVGDRVLAPCASALALTRHQSGEGRFRWLHARPGSAAALVEACAAHQDVAWVAPRERVLDEGWFGPYMSTAVSKRLGDVALVAREDVSFEDPADSGPFVLVCRHGSLTPAEMYVPFVAGSRR
ncbi:MAG: PglZ domain-containing protein [Actinobacteria bacterium]|nr:PglZ domain-containing protein [Actinomycetota bacterium]MSY11495.1 PglZ domain-containing protein [Actinomycetota bacterium]MSZ03992.1 PglZ domain-containing protein [Actinomycetota bacterium]MTB07576.1 PglZ domain-containing protein [Actinomycetota bacterium]